jgi:hypothetical protein
MVSWNGLSRLLEGSSVFAMHLNLQTQQAGDYLNRCDKMKKEWDEWSEF